MKIPQSIIETIDPLSQPEWDRWVARHPRGSIFHTTAWARLLVDTYGFVPFYLVESRGREWIAGLPMMEVKGLTGARRAVSLPFADSCPPLIPLAESAAGSPDDIPSSDAPNRPAGPTAADAAPSCPTRSRNALDVVSSRQPLVRAALNLGRQRRWRSLELREATECADNETCSSEFHGHTLDLSGGETAVLSRFSPATRRAIRKSEQSPLKIVQATTADAMRAYFDLHCLTRRRHGMPPQPWRFFETLHRRLLDAGHGFIVLAIHGERPVAGGVFLHHGSAALYKFGASDEDFLGLRPNNGVFWQAIRTCIARGCAALDLGRTSLSNAGLRRFKLGWGGAERRIAYARYDLATGRLIPTPDRSSGWTTSLFRLLPAPLSQRLGALLYRFAA